MITKSACNTPSYNVSKFLVPKLLHLAENECTIKNSYQFSEKICSLRYTNPYFMCSSDVTSLFTNVPVNETIDIIIEKLFPGDDSKYYNMSKKEFRQLLSLAVKDSVFIFDKKIFKQVEGLAMGSPLAPVMANIFLCHFEKLWLQECPDAYKPKEYIRYVDDTFLLFEDIQQAHQFSNYINSRHVNIKFTIEEEVDGKLPYLDTIVSRDQNNFTTGVYRKATFTGLATNFFSCSPMIYEINSIKTLIHRAYHICSDYDVISQRIRVLKKILS